MKGNFTDTQREVLQDLDINPDDSLEMIIAMMAVKIRSLQVLLNIQCEKY